MQRRAPNATIINLSSKIKATKNKTMAHLMSMTEEQRDGIIHNAIRVSAKIKRTNKMSVLELHREIANRVHAKVAMKQKKERGQIERKLRDITKAGGRISDVLPDCTDQKAAHMVEVIEMKVLGKQVIHVWYDENEKVDIIWNGRITRVERNLTSRDPLLVLTYWDNESIEEDGEDTPISVYQLAADFYCGDLFFV